MKTNRLSVVIVLALAIKLTAQTKSVYGHGGPEPGTFVPHVTSPDNNQPNSTGQNQWVMGNGGWNQYNGSYGSITFGFGNGYPSYGPVYYNGYYGNGFSIKKAARHSLRNAGNIIEEAIGVHNWNEIYSPILAKAIRHYNHAKELYWWGNYQAAYNHAERAQYLAWYSLQYFSNWSSPNSYDNFYPDPYSDPNNPYYKQRPNNTTGMQNGDNYKTHHAPESNQLDKGLPSEGTNDKDIIRSFKNSEMKDE